MTDIVAFLEKLPDAALPQLMALVAVLGLALAIFAIYVVHSVVKGRK